jgi:OHCU decarboxylase
LIQKAEAVWWSLDRDDWWEAFRSHPKIGEKKALAKVSTQSEDWSGQEQAGIHDAVTQTLVELAKLNREYEEKFGFIFIVCATGKSSEEMLAILKSRIGNDLETELPVAASEQAKITKIRLRKLLT